MKIFQEQKGFLQSDSIWEPLVCEATTLTTELLRNVLMIFELTPVKAPNDFMNLHDSTRMSMS